MYDAAATSPRATWSLATALLEGTDGLQTNAARAMKLLRELAACVEEVVEEEIIKADEEGEQETVVVTKVSPSNTITTDDSSSSSDDDCDYRSMAMKKIAYCFLEGNGCKADKARGLAWLKCCFETGKDADAAHELALIYEYAKFGVDQDPTEAAAWFEKAASAGHCEAMAELALCYELGCGVEQSDERALDWYVRAAEAGHVTAHYAVGEAFEEARGVPQSDEEACLWYYRAAVRGCTDSARALRRLEDIARILLPGGARALLDG
jgi:TPR repeat protein